MPPQSTINEECVSITVGVLKSVTLQTVRAGRFQRDMFDDEWRGEARCAGLDVNLFFDKYEEDPKLADKIDKTVCLHCPVIKECFNLLLN